MLSLRSLSSAEGSSKHQHTRDQNNTQFCLKPASNSVANAQKHFNLHIKTTRRSRWRSRLPRQVQADVPARAQRNDDQVSVQPKKMTAELGKEGPNVLKAQLCLCGVAVLWGTYSPVVRYIYACDGPPSPAALTAVRTVIQAVVLLASNVLVARQQLNSVAAPTQRARSLRKSDSPNLTRSASARPRPFRTFSTKVRKALNSTTDELWIAGIELGLWNFCGSTFQALGLQFTSATRGAFLIQVRRMSAQFALDSVCSQYAQAVSGICWPKKCLNCFSTSCSWQATSLLTPVMATVAGDKPSRAVWLGCCFTLCGTVLIALDHTPPTVSHHGPATLSIGMHSSSRHAQSSCCLKRNWASCLLACVHDQVAACFPVFSEWTQ